MSIRLFSYSLSGINALPVEVEVDLLRRLPSVSIVGLPAVGVRETAERVRSAIGASGFDFPRQRVVINLAPTDVRKDPGAYDLPIAIGILAENGEFDLDASVFDGYLFAAELSLTGVLRPIRGAVPAALLAKTLGLKLIVDAQSANVAAVVPGVEVYGAQTLADVVAHLRGTVPLPRGVAAAAPAQRHGLDMADVRGQDIARRAMEIAAAGGHSIRLVGAPGCGKTMLAQRLPSILPPMTSDEAIATTAIYSAAGFDIGLITTRPFRAPHHSASAAGLIGDRTLRPGEASLAHNGVLFLDETPEFSRTGLDMLREPIEDGRIRMTRAAGTVEYPADFLMVQGVDDSTPGFRMESLPRTDLWVRMKSVPASVLLASPAGECSADIRERVIAARQRQADRGQDRVNARLRPIDLDREPVVHTDAGRALLDSAGDMALRVLCVARTVADLGDRDDISLDDLTAAYGFALGRLPDTDTDTDTDRA